MKSLTVYLHNIPVDNSRIRLNNNHKKSLENFILRRRANVEHNTTPRLLSLRPVPVKYPPCTVLTHLSHHLWSLKDLKGGSARGRQTLKRSGDERSLHAVSTYLAVQFLRHSEWTTG